MDEIKHIATLFPAKSIGTERIYDYTEVTCGILVTVKNSEGNYVRRLYPLTSIDFIQFVEE